MEQKVGDYPRYPMGDYMKLGDWAKMYGKSVSAAKYQCQQGRVDGAIKIAGLWFVPWHSKYPGSEAWLPKEAVEVRNGG